MVHKACLREIWELADEKSEKLLIPRVGCHFVSHALRGKNDSWEAGWLASDMSFGASQVQK